MKDLLMITIMIMIFIFGYFIMKHLDDFFEENQRRMSELTFENKKLIQIAAETPALLNSFSEVFRNSYAADPDMEFAISIGSTGTILEKLENGSVDFVLLRENSLYTKSEHLKHLKQLTIPYCSGSITTGPEGMPVTDLDENTMVHILWNEIYPSSDRDIMLLFMKKIFLLDS